MKPALLPLYLSVLVCACATTSSANDVRQAEVRDLSRTEAIASARQDASRTYGNGSGALINAQYANGYWVVELVASNGATLHYAISARDGSIRERAMMQ